MADNSVVTADDLENRNIEVEDGARLARFAIEAMRSDGNHLAVVHAMRPYLPDGMPPQMIGFMHHVAATLMQVEAGLDSCLRVQMPSAD